MLTLIYQSIRDFLFDAAAAKRNTRSFLLWLGSMWIMLQNYTWEQMQTWSISEWVTRLMGATLIGSAGLLTVGQKNMTPEQIQASLDELKKRQQEEKQEAQDHQQ